MARRMLIAMDAGLKVGPNHSTLFLPIAEWRVSSYSDNRSQEWRERNETTVSAFDQSCFNYDLANCVMWNVSSKFEQFEVRFN